MKMHLSGNGTCKNCTLGNGCLTCSGKTGECTSCPNGKILTTTTGNVDSCTDCGVGMWSNGGQSTTCFGIGSESNVVIIIEFQNSTNTTAEEIANEIKRVTGVTVEVISVNKETFEVKIVDGGTTTTDVISLAKKIQDAMRNGSS